LVEHTAENRGVAGSIPALAIINRSPPPPRGGMTTSIDSFSCRPTARADAGRAGIGGDCDDVRAHASSEGETDEVSNVMDRCGCTSVGAYVAQRSRWARPDPRGCARLRRRWSRADFPKRVLPPSRAGLLLEGDCVYLLPSRSNALRPVWRGKQEEHLRDVAWAPGGEHFLVMLNEQPNSDAVYLARRDGTTLRRSLPGARRFCRTGGSSSRGETPSTLYRKGISSGS
jgi:hypothetical protein